MFNGLIDGCGLECPIGIGRLVRLLGQLVSESKAVETNWGNQRWNKRCFVQFCFSTILASRAVCSSLSQRIMNVHVFLLLPRPWLIPPPEKCMSCQRGFKHVLVSLWKIVLAGKSIFETSACPSCRFSVLSSTTK